MPGLTPYRAHGLATHAAVDAGAGSDIRDVQWSAEPVLDVRDIPTTFRSGRSSTGRDVVLAGTPQGGPQSPFAYRVHQLDKPRRRKDGQVVQRRLAWTATPDTITLSTIERDLARRIDGHYAPAGDWALEEQRVFAGRAAASLRKGVIAFDEDVTADSAPSAPASTGGEHADGALAMTYLPRQVRASLVVKVPTPTVFDGDLYLDPDTGATELHLLRMDERTAVVVLASRAPHVRAWSVRQATYDLRPVQELR